MSGRGLVVARRIEPRRVSGNRPLLGRTHSGIKVTLSGEREGKESDCAVYAAVLSSFEGRDDLLPV